MINNKTKGQLIAAPVLKEDKMIIRKRIDRERLQTVIDTMDEMKWELDDIIGGTSMEDHFKEYGRYGLNQLLGNGNPYDNSLYTLIENEKADLEDK